MMVSHKKVYYLSQDNKLIYISEDMNLYYVIKGTRNCGNGLTDVFIIDKQQESEKIIDIEASDARVILKSMNREFIIDFRKLSTAMKFTAYMAAKLKNKEK